MRCYKSILTMLLIFASAGVATAQYPGDLFFANPSLSVKKGETAELEVQLFSGTAVTGGVYFELTFIPGSLEVGEIKPGTNAEFQDYLVFDKSQVALGKLSVASLNGSSMADPFGTVSLAKITVKPLVDVGKKVTITIKVKTILDEKSVKFSKTKGYSGQILVASDGPEGLGGESAGFNLPRNAEETALLFRRPGYTVNIHYGLWQWGWLYPVLIPVPTRDPWAVPEK